MGKSRRNAESRRSGVEQPEMYPGQVAAWMRRVAENQRPPRDSDAIRHHFISQMQLRHFKSPDLKGERIWQIDREHGKPVPILIGEAASRLRLYRARREGGGYTTTVESFLSAIESACKPALDSLLAHPDRLTAGERADIGFLLAAQDVRTPKGMRRALRVAEAVGRLQLGALVANGEIYGPDSGMSPEECETGIREITSGGVYFEAEPETALHALVDGIHQRAALMADLSWTLYRSDVAQLVIGDHGISWYDPTPKYPWSTPAPLSSPNAYGLLPVAPDALLWLANGSGDASLEQRDGTARFKPANRKAYGYADRHVFARDNETLAALYADATEQPDRYPSAPRDCFVVTHDINPSDPTVGREHPTGWPRHIRQPDEHGKLGERRGYTVIYTDDETIPDLGFAEEPANDTPR